MLEVKVFSDTEKGADASAAVMSVIETAKRNELDVYGYLLYLLTVLQKWGANPTEAQLILFLDQIRDKIRRHEHECQG